jgi:phospho-N-acetylmuramoyl-pentapeptide-transferase
VLTVLVAAVVSLIISLFGTPAFIKVLVKRGFGQFIRDDGPTSHHTKRGTPTMGGAVIVLSTLLAYGAAHLAFWTQPTWSADPRAVPHDRAGLRRLPRRLHQDLQAAQPRPALGQKLAGQTLVAVHLRRPRRAVPQRRGTPASTSRSPSSATPGWTSRSPGPVGGLILFVIWANLIVAGTSNGVNLTDGLDGLATGASVMVFAAYVLIGIWQFNQNCQWRPGHQVLRGAVTPTTWPSSRRPGMGACFGFLWWNASPAKIFMGDTGSLALGGALAGLAITHPHRAARRHPRRPVRHHHAVGHHPGRQLQDHRQTGLPHGAAATPLRAPRLGRSHDRHPVLDHRRPLRGLGARACSTPSGWWAAPMTVPPSGVGPVPADPPRRGLGRPARRRRRVSGVSGFAAADALLERGAHVVVVDGAGAPTSIARPSAPEILDILGADAVRPEHVAPLPTDDPVDLVVTSPGWRPDQPLLAAAAAAGIPIWGEVELAWRMRPEPRARPVAGITGTNGKTTTVQMLTSILRPPGCAR